MKGPGKASKSVRQKKLLELIQEQPFLTDEDLSTKFSVSIQTIRLDRLELGIPELRERIKNVAEKNYKKVRSIIGTEIVGELIDLNLGVSGISVLQTTQDMAFSKTNLVRGHHIFSQAESLAMAVIDAEVALTGVSNIKYLNPVKAGDKLVAKAEVVRVRGNNHFVHVRTKVDQVQVFRGKFILVVIEEGGIE
ncbi:transcription factor FapR [Clostridium formicaceticum]|uniref:Fatty acid biosynthesis transcriptional regulator n=1 Tax=Clostridium formicaceticum TaxID=1497 RepID=A0AAC9WGF1_9CLOT|nr:transcription factor FapR [Clostridium formicaceticum]AOY77353.1 fatty acid biosynthesis transcriptional regulator [Clostridium formicaceticum]ARE87897.1 Transcription factor FapR [Clostridium formicaceticum]